MSADEIPAKNEIFSRFFYFTHITKVGILHIDGVVFLFSSMVFSFSRLLFQSSHWLLEGTSYRRLHKLAIVAAASNMSV